MTAHHPATPFATDFVMTDALIDTILEHAALASDSMDTTPPQRAARLFLTLAGHYGQTQGTLGDNVDAMLVDTMTDMLHLIDLLCLPPDIIDNYTHLAQTHYDAEAVAHG